MTLGMIELERYFDYNATAPLCPAARQAWLEVADRHWTNASSVFPAAQRGRQLLDELRGEMASLLGVSAPERIVFTSGATEGTNAVIQHWSQEGGAIAISSIEHPCVRLAAAGYFGPDRMLDIGVEPSLGVIDLETVERITSMGKNLAGVAVMAANHETGVLQPWDDIQAICRSKGVPLLCDATQWLGKKPARGLANLDYFIGSAHKFGGPKGVGFIVLPEDSDQCDFIGQLGGPQENGRRGGTEDLAGISAMVAAYQQQHEGYSTGDGRDQFEKALEFTGDYKIVGKQSPRLANTSLVVVPHAPSHEWIKRLYELGFVVSTSSACSAGEGNPSQVVLAMDIPFEEMGSLIRVSSGPGQGEREWRALFDAFLKVEDEIQS